MRGGAARARDENGVPVCRRGHLMTEGNTYKHPGVASNPQCRECKRMMRNKLRRTRRLNYAGMRQLIQYEDGDAVKKPTTADKCPRCKSTKVLGPRVVQFDRAPWCTCYSCGHHWQPPVEEEDQG